MEKVNNRPMAACKFFGGVLPRDSIASNTAAWIGALYGIDVWPRKWVDTVQQANLRRMDLEQTGYNLIEKNLANETVRLEVMQSGGESLFRLKEIKEGKR